MAEQQNPDRPTAPSADEELTRAVVEQKLATQEEVERCLAAHAQSGSDSLAETMVRETVLTPGQVTRVKALLEASRGQQIPGYQILSKLGAGAMATVFKARQISLDRMVAIKVLPRKLSENADYVRRFYKEGKAAALLNHANIVQAFDVGESGGFHYFVMEYVEGHTLHDELASGKTFSESDAIDVILQVARALAHAHSQGLIHRDVKPKNIMIAPDGTAKLADMGLARVTTDIAAAQAEAGRAYGTPYYISPEQIRGEVDIDARADIYSLGATLYHLVTHRVPFEAPTPAGVMHKHLKEPLTPPDHLNPELSLGLAEVVEAMLAKDRKRRYASVTDLIMDLVALKEGQPPLQARKHLSDAVLSGLTESRPGDETQLDMTPPPESNGMMVWVIVLATALAISILVNIILLAN